MIEDFVRTYKLGAATRVFAKRREDVDKTVASVVSGVNQVLSREVCSQPVFSRVDVLVLEDERYADCDCGETYVRLQEEFWQSKKVRVHRLHEGDPFCGALNECMFQQISAGMDFTLLWSCSVSSYLTNENVHAMLQALEVGARVTGMVLKELEQSILEGRVLATCCIWHNRSFARVGLYDLRLGQPFATTEVDKPYSPHFTELDGKQVYTVAGVEEIIPLLRMTAMFGTPFIAPIKPVGDGVWNEANDAERERKKVDSKVARQQRAVALDGGRLAQIRDMVMMPYRSL